MKLPAFSSPAKYPWLRQLPPSLVAANLRVMLQRQADVVDAVEQTAFAKRIELEAESRADRCFDRLSLEVDAQAVTRLALYLFEQILHLNLGQNDGQHAVLQADAVEDVGNDGGDERPNEIGRASW